MEKDFRKLLKLIEKLMSENWNEKDPLIQEIDKLLRKNNWEGIDLDELVEDNTL